MQRFSRSFPKSLPLFQAHRSTVTSPCISTASSNFHEVEASLRRLKGHWNPITALHSESRSLETEGGDVKHLSFTLSAYLLFKFKIGAIFGHCEAATPRKRAHGVKHKQNSWHRRLWIGVPQVFILHQRAHKL